ncbi:MAG: hypothetical protein ACT4PU_05030 [Planctomycetota bacterium]
MPRNERAILTVQSSAIVFVAIARDNDGAGSNTRFIVVAGRWVVRSDSDLASIVRNNLTLAAHDFSIRSRSFVMRAFGNRAWGVTISHSFANSLKSRSTGFFDLTRPLCELKALFGEYGVSCVGHRHRRHKRRQHERGSEHPATLR